MNIKVYGKNVKTFFREGDGEQQKQLKRNVGVFLFGVGIDLVSENLERTYEFAAGFARFDLEKI